MSYRFSAANVVYIKNLSPVVKEEDIRQMFEKCDEILQISFHNFFGSTQRYCMVMFKTSAGITNASSLNQTPLLGIPMNISVIDPAVQGNASAPSGFPHTGATNPPIPTPQQAASNTAATGAAGGAAFPVPMQQHQAQLLEIAMQNHYMNVQAREEAVQSAAVQAKLLAERRMNELGISAAATGSDKINGNVAGLQGYGGGYFLKNNVETERQKQAKTIYVDNFPPSYTETDIKSVFAGVGTINEIRIDTLCDGLNTRFVLIEFLNVANAETAIKMDGMEIAGHKLKISKAKCTVNYMDPDGVEFDLASVLPAVPVAYQQMHKMKLEEKMAKVKLLEDKLLKKLNPEKEGKTVKSEQPNTVAASKAYERSNSRSPSRRASSRKNNKYRERSSYERRRHKRSLSSHRSESSGRTRDLTDSTRVNYMRRRKETYAPWWVKEEERLKDREDRDRRHDHHDAYNRKESSRGSYRDEAHGYSSAERSRNHTHRKYRDPTNSHNRSPDVQSSSSSKASKSPLKSYNNERGGHSSRKHWKSSYRGKKEDNNDRASVASSASENNKVGAESSDKKKHSHPNGHSAASDGEMRGDTNINEKKEIEERSVNESNDKEIKRNEQKKYEGDYQKHYKERHKSREEEVRYSKNYLNSEDEKKEAYMSDDSDSLNGRRRESHKRSKKHSSDHKKKHKKRSHYEEEYETY